MKKITPKAKIYILIILLSVIIFIVGIFVYNHYKPSGTKPLTNTGFACMSDAEQERLTEIMIGVSDDTIPVTESLKSEYWGIFTRCNTSEKDINWYIAFGPMVVINYESLFLPDVLASFEAGVPVKSKDRQTFEELVLSNGTMTAEVINSYNSDIEGIIKKEIPPGYTAPVLTKEKIESLLAVTKEKLSRVETLLNN